MKRPEDCESIQDVRQSMDALPQHTLLRTFLNNCRSGGLCAVTSGPLRDVLIVVPGKPLRDVTWITKPLLNSLVSEISRRILGRELFTLLGPWCCDLIALL